MTSPSHPPDSPRSPECEPPIFVFGAARSGTTLTYSLLLSSGSFPIYQAESRILECASRYGPLRSGRNRAAFLRDFLRSRQFSRSGLTEATVSKLAAQRAESYADFLDGFMTEMCRLQGKKRWVEKSPNNMQFVADLDRRFPAARFIHVIRDGRSVAVSQRRHGGAKYSRDPQRQLVWIANVWEQQVSAGRRAARLGAERYMEIRYEDLVTDLQSTLARLNAFACLSLDLATVSRSDVGSLGRPNTAFRMESGGVSDTARERWREVLSSEEVALLNWQIGDSLKELGYHVEETAFDVPALEHRLLARAGRMALDWKHRLNVSTPFGRLARRPLEIGLS